MALCSICAKRQATCIDDDEGRPMPVCALCRDEEVPDPGMPPNTSDRVLRYVRMSPGVDVVDIAIALGEESDAGRKRISAALARAIKAGLMTSVGQRNGLYYPTRRLLALPRGATLRNAGGKAA